MILEKRKKGICWLYLELPTQLFFVVVDLFYFKRDLFKENLSTVPTCDQVLFSFRLVKHSHGKRETRAAFWEDIRVMLKLGLLAGYNDIFIAVSQRIFRTEDHECHRHRFLVPIPPVTSPTILYTYIDRCVNHVVMPLSAPIRSFSNWTRMATTTKMLLRNKTFFL